MNLFGSLNYISGVALCAGRLMKRTESGGLAGIRVGAAPALTDLMLVLCDNGDYLAHKE